MRSARLPRGTRRHAAAFHPVRIFTEGEKRAFLAGQLFQGVDLKEVDFSSANLSLASFVNASLRWCDFSAACLLGVSFLRCDLRGARFDKATFDQNRFDESRFSDASGLSERDVAYIEGRGGSFQRFAAQSPRA